MEKSQNVSLLSLPYWITAAQEIKKMRVLTFSAMIIALGLIVNLFSIPVGLNLHISLTFLVLACGSLVFGPIVGLYIGLIYDFLGYVMYPSGVFFPGYTLSTMLEFFIYGIFLYRKRITVFGVLTAKAIVNFGIHVILGSLWSSMLYGKGYYYFFAKSLTKNIIMLPVEVILLIILLRILMPALSSMRLIPKEQCSRIKIF